ncbi:MAG: LytR/AlgR family response regulator transcription factor [Bulleidia sp.]
MYRAAVVEDQIAEAQILVSLLKKYVQENQMDMNISLYQDGDEFLDETGPFDIVFLDIEMKRVDGLRTARTIRMNDDHAVIVFVTKMVNLALEGYSVDAADFIIKPVVYESFAMRMNRIMRRLKHRHQICIELKTGSTSSFVNIHDIDYIEARDRKVSVHLQNHNEIQASEPLYALEAKLISHGFYRPHIAFLVNLAHVRSVSTNTVMVNDTPVPVSKHRRKEFMKVLTEFRSSHL